MLRVLYFALTSLHVTSRNVRHKVINSVVLDSAKSTEITQGCLVKLYLVRLLFILVYINSCQTREDIFKQTQPFLVTTISAL